LAARKRHRTSLLAVDLANTGGGYNFHVQKVRFARWLVRGLPLRRCQHDGVSRARHEAGQPAPHASSPSIVKISLDLETPLEHG